MTQEGQADRTSPIRLELEAQVDELGKTKGNLKIVVYGLCGATVLLWGALFLIVFHLNPITRVVTGQDGAMEIIYSNPAHTFALLLVSLCLGITIGYWAMYKSMSDKENSIAILKKELADMRIRFNQAQHSKGLREAGTSKTNQEEK